MAGWKVLLILLSWTCADAEERARTARAARAQAAIVGGMVADAAAMPLHWQYDTAAIASLLSDCADDDARRCDAAFFEPSQVRNHALVALFTSHLATPHSLFCVATRRSGVPSSASLAFLPRCLHLLPS